MGYMDYLELYGHNLPVPTDLTPEQEASDAALRATIDTIEATRPDVDPAPAAPVDPFEPERHAIYDASGRVVREWVNDVAEPVDAAPDPDNERTKPRPAGLIGSATPQDEPENLTPADNLPPREL